jgi:hypothetical protein
MAEAVEELAAKKGLGVRRYYQRTSYLAGSIWDIQRIA